MFSLHPRLTGLGRKKQLYLQLDIDSGAVSAVLGVCAMDVHLEFIQGTHTDFVILPILQSFPQHGSLSH